MILENVPESKTRADLQVELVASCKDAGSTVYFAFPFAVDCPMPVSHFIVHRFRSQPDGQVACEFAPQACDERKIPLDLIDELKGAYLSRLSREYGSFDAGSDSDAETETPLLQQELEAFIEDEQDFLGMTRTLLQALEKMLQGQNLDLDRYVVCFKEKSVEIENFYLLFIATNSVFEIAQDLSVASRESLDFGASLFGIKVDIKEWKQEQNYAYLSFVAPRSGRELIEAFTALTGFSKGIDKKEDTQTFLKGVEAFADQVPEDQVNDYRNQVVDYCLEQDQRHEPIDVRDLAMSVDSVDSDAFSQFMSDYSARDAGGLRMDRQSLRRYVRFQGRERDLAISFSSHQLNNRVHYNQDTDTISITGIPKALRRQLLEHLES